MYKTGNYVIYKEHMNLRERPTASSKALGVIPMGTCIEVYETVDNWGKTDFSGVGGWCCISECFAKPLCVCENSQCCYYEKFCELEKKYCELISKTNKIKEILK